MNIPKRHFYNNKNYKLDFDKKIMILNSDFHNKLLNKKLWNRFGFKKIGGSSVGDVLETDDFKSQFNAFARMSWCGIPVLDRKYVDAGIAIEPKVINTLNNLMNIEIQTFNPEDYNYDYFLDKDNVIGGIPDGFIRERKIILEIKTTNEKNYALWNEFGVPVSYLKQAQIYTFLMNVKEYWIVATFLKNEDYENPNQYPIKKRRLKNYKYKINASQVEDDIDKIKKWYKKHTISGISPEWNEFKDKDLIEYLKCENEKEYVELLKKWKLEGKYVE